MNRSFLYRCLGIIALSCSLFFYSDAFCQHNESGQEADKKMYTAYNIWIWPKHNMICLNYKGARTKIPVGTEVKNIQIVDFRSDLFMGSDDQVDHERIRFSLVNPRNTYIVRFIPSYHPGATIKDYKRFMFTPKTFEELSSAFNPYENAAIKEGVIAQGMRKDAVLACYGPPSERHTRGMEKNTWVYFINKNERIKIHFAKNPITGLEEVKQIDLLKGRRFQTGITSYPHAVVEVPQPKPQRQAQPQPRALPQKKDDVEYKLIKLKQLYEKGLITEEEYEKKRQQIMDDF